MKEQTLKIEKIIKEFSGELEKEGYTVVLNVSKEVDSGKSINFGVVKGFPTDVANNFIALKNSVDEAIPGGLSFYLLQQILSSDECDCPNCTSEKRTEEETNAFEGDEDFKNFAESFIRTILGGSSNNE